MAYQKGRRQRDPVFPRGQSDGLILSDDLAHEIRNMYPTDEGSLRAVWGPATYVPLKTTITDDGIVLARAGNAPPSVLKNAPPGSPLKTTDETLPVYGRTQHGIHHSLLFGGERSVLLLHTGNELWEFRGWTRNWRQLLSNPRGSHGIKDTLRNDTSARFPTQFENTGNGIVIVPQEGRAYFYDGHSIVPLGFTRKPTAPIGRGPGSSAMGTRTGDGIAGSNDTGYAHSGLYAAKDAYIRSGMTYGFGPCRVGTPNPYFTDVEGAKFSAGLLEEGEWRCKVQYIDKFGNLSALSEPSEPITVRRQGAELGDAANQSDIADDIPWKGTSSRSQVDVDYLKLQFAWTGIPTGPKHCVGRILYRTMDVKNAGTAKYFQLPQDTSPTFTGFASLPDNVTTTYPDNISDGLLGVEAQNIIPTPQFRLCRAAFGRLFVANLHGDEGRILYSLPGRWGTFQMGDSMYPDATGGQITGLWRCDQGLLAFTHSSTFLIQASGDGSSFRPIPISQEIGCDAPNSIQTLADGSVLWLSQSGFYMYDGQQVQFASSDLTRLFKKITLGRLPQACSMLDPTTLEYRCWVSINGSQENNLCITYSGDGWRTRDDVLARDACVTQDHRAYPLIAGQVKDFRKSGVFLLDHMGNKNDTNLQEAISTREAEIETVWLKGTDSKQKGTIPSIYLWFRETEKSQLNIEVMRDWREDVVETVQVNTYSTVDVPSFWGEAKLGQSGAKFRRRRPYWSRAQIYLPSSESFKLRIKGTGMWEFVGLSYDDAPRSFGNAQLPR